MGTETNNENLYQSRINHCYVKLNNPLMGTETVNRLDEYAIISAKVLN